MVDALHEHARMLARNLLRLQICTIGKIAETLELEPPEVQQLAVEVYDERAEQLTALRQIMNDIKEGHSGRQQQEALLFDAIGILNQLLHRREPGRGEIADIRNWIRNLADHDLVLYLDKLYAGGIDGEILIHGGAFLDSVYALFMRTHYDDLRRNDDGFVELDTTAAPPAHKPRPRTRLMRGMKRATMHFLTVTNTATETPKKKSLRAYCSKAVSRFHPLPVIPG